jgi:hypothetical protein
MESDQIQYNAPYPDSRRSGAELCIGMVPIFKFGLSMVCITHRSTLEMNLRTRENDVEGVRFGSDPIQVDG